MSDFNFPLNPTTGQIHTHEGQSWSWTGVAWRAVALSQLSWEPISATGTGASQNITLPVLVSSKADVLVFVNGTVLHASEYSISGTTLTLTSNASGDAIEVRSANGTSAAVNTALVTGEPYYRMSGFFAASPAVNEVLMIYVMDVPVTIPANWSGSQVKLIGVQPVYNFVLSVRKNSTVEIGTISVDPSGVATLATSGGVSVSLVEGDAVSIHAPGTTDNITNLTWLLRGNK